MICLLLYCHLVLSHLWWLHHLNLAYSNMVVKLASQLVDSSEFTYLLALTELTRMHTRFLSKLVRLGVNSVKSERTRESGPSWRIKRSFFLNPKRCRLHFCGCCGVCRGGTSSSEECGDRAERLCVGAIRSRGHRDSCGGRGSCDGRSSCVGRAVAGCRCCMWFVMLVPFIIYGKR